MSKDERPSDQLSRLIMEIGGGWIKGSIIGYILGIIAAIIIILLVR